VSVSPAAPSSPSARARGMVMRLCPRTPAHVSPPPQFSRSIARHENDAKAVGILADMPGSGDAPAACALKRSTSSAGRWQARKDCVPRSVSRLPSGRHLPRPRPVRAYPPAKDRLRPLIDVLARARVRPAGRGGAPSPPWQPVARSPAALGRANPELWRQVVIVRGWFCVRRRRCRRARVLGWGARCGRGRSCSR
jgi:hypothetical protein